MPGYGRAPIKQRGSVMWAFIINLVYDQSCEKYLAEASRQANLWI